MAQKWRTFKGTTGWWAWNPEPWDRLNYNPQETPDRSKEHGPRQRRLSAGEPTRKEKENRPWPDVSWEVKFAYCSKSWLSGCWKFGTRRRVNQEEKHLDWSQSRHSLMHTQKGLHNFLPFLDWLKISPRSLWEVILSTGKSCMKSMLQAAFHRSLLLSDVTLTASPGHSSTAVPMLGFVCLSVPLGYKTFYLDNS